MARCDASSSSTSEAILERERKGKRNVGDMRVRYAGSSTRKSADM